MAYTLKLTRLVDGKPLTDDYSSAASVYLDRVFLLQSPETRFAPRRHHAPEIFACRGRWLLYNRSDSQTLTLTSPSGFLVAISPETLRWLDDGVSVLDAYDVAVRIEASGEFSEPIEAVSGPATQTVGGARRQGFVAMLESDERYREILAARFQAYFFPVQDPQPLTALETAQCLGGSTEQEVNNAQSTVKYRTGLNLGDVGPFLRTSRIVTVDDVQDLPHADCNHPWLERSRS